VKSIKRTNLHLSKTKLYSRHYDLVDRCGISMSQVTTDMFHFSLFMTYHRVCN